MPLHDNPNIATAAIARCVLRLMRRSWRMNAHLKFFFVGNQGEAHKRLKLTSV